MASIFDIMGGRKKKMEDAVVGIDTNHIKPKKKAKVKAKETPKASAFDKPKIDLGKPSNNPNETFEEYKKRTASE